MNVIAMLSNVNSLFIAKLKLKRTNNRRWTTHFFCHSKKNCVFMVLQIDFTGLLNRRLNNLIEFDRHVERESENASMWIRCDFVFASTGNGHCYRLLLMNGFISDFQCCVRLTRIKEPKQNQTKIASFLPKTDGFTRFTHVGGWEIGLNWKTT